MDKIIKLLGAKNWTSYNNLRSSENCNQGTTTLASCHIMILQYPKSQEMFNLISRYWHYIATLPKSLHFNKRHHVLTWNSRPEARFYISRVLDTSKESDRARHIRHGGGEAARDSSARIKCRWRIGKLTRLRRWQQLSNTSLCQTETKRERKGEGESHEETPESCEAAAAAAATTGWCLGASRRGYRATTQRAPVQRQRLLQLTYTTFQRGLPQNIRRQRVSHLPFPSNTRDQLTPPPAFIKCLNQMTLTGRLDVHATSLSPSAIQTAQWQ